MQTSSTWSRYQYIYLLVNIYSQCTLSKLESTLLPFSSHREANKFFFVENTCKHTKLWHKKGFELHRSYTTTFSVKNIPLGCVLRSMFHLEWIDFDTQRKAMKYYSNFRRSKNLLDKVKGRSGRNNTQIIFSPFCLLDGSIFSPERNDGTQIFPFEPTGNGNRVCQQRWNRAKQTIPLD